MYNSCLMQMRTTASAVILKIQVHNYNVQRTNNALANVNIHHNPCNVSPNSSSNSLGKAIMDVRMIVV